MSDQERVRRVTDGPRTWMELKAELSEWLGQRLTDGPWESSAGLAERLRAAGWRSPEEMAADPFAGVAKIITAIEEQGFHDIFLGTEPNAEEEERWGCRFLGPDEVYGWGPTPLIAAQKAAAEWQREARRRAARSKA